MCYEAIIGKAVLAICLYTSLHYCDILMYTKLKLLDSTIIGQSIIRTGTTK